MRFKFHVSFQKFAIIKTEAKWEDTNIKSMNLKFFYLNVKVTSFCLIQMNRVEFKAFYISKHTRKIIYPYKLKSVF